MDICIESTTLLNLKCNTHLNFTSEVSIDKIVLNKAKYLTLNLGAMGNKNASI